MDFQVAVATAIDELISTQDFMDTIADIGEARSGARKPDIHAIAQDIFQIKKLLTGLCTNLGLSIPADVC